jgi:ornithine cyclodeaminase
MPSEARLLLLNKNQVEVLLQPDDVLQAVREAFILHSEGTGRLFPVVKERLAEGSAIGIRSGDAQAQGLLGLKAAGSWPRNRERGSDAHQATILLIDPATGRPVCVIDGNAVTTMRTGAAGALGLLHLARHDSTRACLFGTGVQARIQLSYALKVLPALRHVRYVTKSMQRDVIFEAHFANRCHITHATDRNAAVAESDVVITATPGAGPLFDRGAVRPGTHFNCVGTDTKGKRELPEGLLTQVRLFVDDRTQARQIGETQWATDTPCTELGDLIAGKVQATRQPMDITVFDMTGIALQDLTVAHLLRERAGAANEGSSVAWPW